MTLCYIVKRLKTCDLDPRRHSAPWLTGGSLSPTAELCGPANFKPSANTTAEVGASLGGQASWQVECWTESVAGRREGSGGGARR